MCDLEIFFDPASTAHNGERGATPEPAGKKPVVVRNVSLDLYKDFIDADDPGKFYLDTIAIKAQVSPFIEDKVTQVFSIVPGIAVATRRVTEIRNMVRTIQSLKSKHI